MPRRIVYFQNGDELEEYSTEEEEDEPDKVRIPESNRIFLMEFPENHHMRVLRKRSKIIIRSCDIAARLGRGPIPQNGLENHGLGLVHRQPRLLRTPKNNQEIRACRSVYAPSNGKAIITNRGTTQFPGLSAFCSQS